MNNTDAASLVRRLFLEGFSKNDADVLRDVLAEDFVLTSAGAVVGDGSARNGTRETLIAGMQHNHRSFSGWHFTLEHVLADSEHAAARWTGQGRHTGSFAGEAPTGHMVRLHGNSIYRIADGKIAQDWVFADQLAFRTALGLNAAPAPGPGEILVRRFWDEVINAHEPDAADVLMSASYRQNAPGIAQGPEGFKAFFCEVLQNSRGMRAEVVAVIDTGPVVVSSTDIRFDAPPPDWPARLRITDVFRTDGRRLTEHWDII